MRALGEHSRGVNTQCSHSASEMSFLIMRIVKMLYVSMK